MVTQKDNFVKEVRIIPPFRGQQGKTRWKKRGVGIKQRKKESMEAKKDKKC